MAKVKAMALAGGFSGKLGSVVFVEQPSGTVMRPRVIPKNPRSPAQSAWRMAMKRAGEAFKALTSEEYQAWEAYCQQIATPGERMKPVNQVFIGLGAKAYSIQSRLGLEPTIPTLPPAAPFGGDGVLVTVSAEPGGVRFQSSHPNTDDVATELLLQPVSSLFAASFDTLYRTKSAVAFTEATPSVLVPATPGCYACAIRLVRVASGQQTGILRLGSVRV